MSLNYNRRKTNDELLGSDYKDWAKNINRIGHNLLEYYDDYDQCKTIRYTYTDIIKYYKDYVNINTDGKTTATSKKHINKYLYEYNCNIFQKDFYWYLKDSTGKVYDYYDNIKINYDGVVVNH